MGSFSAGNMSPDQILHAATAVTMPAKPILPTGRSLGLGVRDKKIERICTGFIGSFSVFELFLREEKKRVGRERKGEIVYLKVRSSIPAKKQAFHQRMFVNTSFFLNPRGREEKNYF